MAAAVGGAAARAAVDRFGNWLASPSPAYNMQAMRQALPGPSQRTTRGRARGRGRRGRGRRGRQGGQPSQGINTRASTSIVVRDTEVIGAPTGAIQQIVFNPGCEGTPRLTAFEKMYRRYRMKYCNIAFKSGSGTATAGNVAIGVAVGPPLSVVKSKDLILKLKPSFYVPAWKNESLTLGADIDLSRFMLCGDTSADGVAFTLYVFGQQDAGMIQVSYEVEFSHPIPF